MRSMLVVSLAALGLIAAGCTEAQREDAGQEAAQAVDTAGSELKQAAEKVDLEAAAEKTKEVASDIGSAAKDAAGDIKEGVDRAGSETAEEARAAERAADNAAEDAKR